MGKFLQKFRISHQMYFLAGFTVLSFLLVGVYFWVSVPTGSELKSLLVGVLISGVLVSIVIAQFRDSTDDAARTAFVASGRSFIEAAQRFQLDHGEFPESAASGILPDGFGDYIQANYWTSIYLRIEKQNQKRFLYLLK